MQFNVIVFHGEFPTSGFGMELGKLKNHQPVASFTFTAEDGALTARDACRRAWSFTQNIEDSWSIPADVMKEVFGSDKRDGHPSMILLRPLGINDFKEPLGHRSSMVGDIFLVTAEDRTPQLYAVDSFDFRPIGLF